MAFKEYIGHTIVFLITGAVLFFLMIILISEAKVHNRNNLVNSKITVQSVDYGRWGQIPGNFSVDYQRHITPYTIDSFDNDANTVGLNKQDISEFTVEKNLTKPIWSPIKSVIEYVETTLYTASAETNADSDILSTFNYGALSTWYQMTHKPRYWSAWSALSQISNILNQSPMINLYYAYNSYNYIFSDYEMVQTGILPQFNATSQDLIYNDEIYGMASSSVLMVWVEAMLEKEDSKSDLTVYNTIIAYYQGLEIEEFDETTMDQIVGAGSLLNQMVITLETELLRYGPYNQKGAVKEYQIIQLQWGRADLFNAPQLQLPGVEGQPSVGTPIINPMWSTYPEYGFVAQNWASGNADDNMLNQTVSTNLLSQDTDSYQTLLNPSNMKEFFRLYEEKLYPAIATRFNLEQIQCDIMYTYLNNMIDNFLFQNQDGPEAAMYGYLLSKSFSTSFNLLKETLPIQTTTRNMNVHTANDTNDDTCETMFTINGETSTGVKTMCSTYNNLVGLDDMMFFINATWYCSTFDDTCDYYNWVKGNGSMSDSDMSSVYDTETEGTFGYVLATTLSTISTYYGCSDAANCTSDYLAELQWGTSGVTLDPYQLNDLYNPVNNTVIGWSDTDYSIVGLSQTPPELFYYSQESGSDFSLTVEQVQSLESSVPQEYGVMNYYNAERMTVAYFSQNQTMTDLLQIGTSYDLYSFVEAMFPHIETWLLQSSFTTLTEDQILNGYDNPVVGQIIGGDWVQGADFDLTDYVLPTFNYQRGAIAGAKFGVRTGAIEKYDVCSIRFLNDVAFVNKIQTIFNGTGYVNMTQQPSLMTGHTKAELFDFAGIGVQFEAFQENKDDSVLRLYEPYTMQIFEFTKETSSELGDAKLQLDHYTNPWSSYAIDIGFANNNFYTLGSTGCSNCASTSTDKAYTIQVDGADWNIGTGDSSTHEIVIQPTTGYTYSQAFEYTVMLNVTSPAVKSAKPAFPLQSISSIIGVSMPLYDMAESQTAGETEYYADQSFVAIDNNTLSSASIAMIVLCVLFLVFGIGAIIVWKLGNKSTEEKREQLIESEARRAEILDNGNSYN